MSNHLLDNHGRPVNYLRLSVTDRCNLRCFYCMPETGIRYLPRKELLTYEEMEWLVRFLANMGITKLRITGGEPFVRNNLMDFLHKISKVEHLNPVKITTNGVLIHHYLQELKDIGIQSVNLSLDTLREETFKKITRRNDFKNVIRSFEQLIALDFNVKINMVVMDNINKEDIIPMVELTKDLPVSVRFIEEMPFNGRRKERLMPVFDYKQILGLIEDYIDPDHSTSVNYKIKNYRGEIGIIAAFSRIFCGTCNRIRITAQGMMKTCLYDHGVLNIKQVLRSGADEEEIKAKILKAIGSRPENGFVAEKNRIINESMATIGG